VQEAEVGSTSRGHETQDSSEPPGALAGPGVRVLLAGTGSHVTGSALPPVAAVGPTLAELGRVLVQRCGADPTGIDTVIDPAGPLELGATLTAAADQATGVLVSLRAPRRGSRYVGCWS
jgi:hypothetical protein